MGVVGFIGLGAMGARMARNLVKNGRKLMVYDLEPERVEAVVKDALPLSFGDGGIIPANSIYELASESSTVITMLPNSKDVFNCYKRILPHFRQEKILCIDSSTIDPFTTREVYQFLIREKNNIDFIDAPVSGGVTGAQNGTLTFMAGGTIEGFAEAKFILSSMGKNIVHCGPIGSGQVAKICNNLLAGISMIGTSEAFILGEKLGVQKETLFKVLKTGETKSWTTDTYCPVDGLIDGIPSSRNYKDGFACGLMAKDLELAKSLGRKIDVPLLMGGMAGEIYKTLGNNEEFKHLDFGVVYKFLKGGK
ncbi:hypothetical protein FO519_001846 [Halicephalobus sp. NKZ332]|nr:hypothetical protein FO519_001846 [Halicephalobus sp. NKZ332]